MPFRHLKKALKIRDGEESPDGNSISFYKNDGKLIFSGTNEMIFGLDGKKHERVEIMLNGDDLNLSPWLHEETPILMTGNKVVKNKRGKPKNCINICDDILKDLGFQKYVEPWSKKQSIIIKKNVIKVETPTISIPSFLKQLVDDIRKLKEDPEHKERDHESLVESFYEKLGYIKVEEIKYRRGHIDIKIQLNGKTIIVNEVKPNWNLSYSKPGVLKQAFNYALEAGSRYVIITNADYYAIFDRNKGYSYYDHLVGEFRLSMLTQDDLKSIELLKKEVLLTMLPPDVQTK
jgi:hypothetical protein